MKRVYTAESVIQVAHIRNMLEAEGIRSEMRNERLGGVIGEIPFLDMRPDSPSGMIPLFDNQQRDIRLFMLEKGGGCQPGKTGSDNQDIRR